jgi:hypothetical protein
MDHEAQRLSSFNRATWPHSGTSLTPERLAAAGFFAAPTPKAPDRVVCFSCENALTNWDPTDDPWIEHKTWYPACPFVQGKSTGNVPLSKVPASSLQIHGKNKSRDRPVQRTGHVEILVNDSSSSIDAANNLEANGSDRGNDGNKMVGVGLNSYIQNLKCTSSKEELGDEVNSFLFVCPFISPQTIERTPPVVRFRLTKDCCHSCPAFHSMFHPANIVHHI